MPSPAVEYLKRQLSRDFQDKSSAQKLIMSGKASVAVDMEDTQSPTAAFVFHPSENRPQRSDHPDRSCHGHNYRSSSSYSFGRQLSRRFSQRAKQLRESSGCNSTACAISAVFIISILALVASVANFYLYISIHGFGPSTGPGTKTVRFPEDDAVTSSGNTAVPHIPAVTAMGHRMAPRPEGGSRAYAHVVGSGKANGKGDSTLDRVLLWKKNVSENVNLDSLETSGLLRITEPGFYFVYSQLYFSDSDEDAQEEGSTGKLPMYFQTLLNGQPMMKSVAPFKEFSTKYHGGIFHLDVNDQIEIKVSNNDLRLSFLEENSFFGVFMVSSTSSSSS